MGEMTLAEICRYSGGEDCDSQDDTQKYKYFMGQDAVPIGNPNDKKKPSDDSGPSHLKLTG
jgi:hypothetical protein